MKEPSHVCLILSSIGIIDFIIIKIKNLTKIRRMNQLNKMMMKNKNK